MWFGRGRRAWSRDIAVIEVEYEKCGVFPGFLLSVEMSLEQPLEEVPGLRDWPFRRASRSPRPKCKTLEAMQLVTQSKGVATYDGLFVQGGLGSACVFLHRQLRTRRRLSVLPFCPSCAYVHMCIDGLQWM